MYLSKFQTVCYVVENLVKSHLRIIMWAFTRNFAAWQFAPHLNTRREFSKVMVLGAILYYNCAVELLSSSARLRLSNNTLWCLHHLLVEKWWWWFAQGDAKTSYHSRIFTLRCKGLTIFIDSKNHTIKTTFGFDTS